MISLTSLQAGSPVSYAIALVLPALDAIIPAVPAETAVVTLGVTTAGTSDLRIVLLVACAAVGAFAGDNLGYFVGRRFGPAVERRFFSTPKGAQRRARAEGWLQRFGTPAIIVCRFIPGGRTAVTLSCGLIGFPRRRFIPATAVAAILWAAYSFFLGRLGGHAFENDPWAGLAAALGITVVLTGLIEGGRRAMSRWHRRADPRASPPDHHDGHRVPPPAAGWLKTTPAASRCARTSQALRERARPLTPEGTAIRWTPQRSAWWCWSRRPRASRRCCRAGSASGCGSRRPRSS